jgi:peptidoglycan/LPS O-acetylase OafA/YrhL
MQASPQPTLPAIRNRHIPALDGLRGMAILLVILWHYASFTQSFLPGWAGVDLFFVLSGYLITERLMVSQEKGNYFSRFYRNRALRIFPLYYAFVIAFLLLIFFFVGKEHLPTLDTYINHWPSFLIFTENWTFIRYHVPKDLSMAHLWSVAVEVQFYLVWPFIILLTRDTKFRIKAFPILLLGILAARTIFYLSDPSGRERIHQNSFFRMDSFLMGSLLYQFHDARLIIPAKLVRRCLLAILAALIAGSFISGDVIPFNGFYSTVGFTLLALFFAGILHLAVQQETNGIASFFNGRTLRFLGKRSYCIYIVHLPILLAVYTRLSILGSELWPGHTVFFHVVAVLLSLALSLFVSIISYRYFESYFLRIKR